MALLCAQIDALILLKLLIITGRYETTLLLTSVCGQSCKSCLDLLAWRQLQESPHLWKFLDIRSCDILNNNTITIITIQLQQC